MKTFFQKIGLFFTAIFGLIPKNVRKNIDLSIQVGEQAKAFFANPALDIVTGLTQTNVDDKILEGIRRGLTLFVSGAQLTKEVTEAKTDVELAAALRKAYFNVPENLRNAFIAKMASFLARYLTKEQIGQILSEVEADTWTQMRYLQKKA